jgi:hypothetical protein
MPAPSGIRRLLLGGGGVARRVTPSGDGRTRRSATVAAAAVTPGFRSARYQLSPVVRLVGATMRQVAVIAAVEAAVAAVAAVAGALAGPGLFYLLRPTLARIPGTATHTSPIATRIAASRCSRRAAAIRVAIATRFRMGNNSPAAPSPSLTYWNVDWLCRVGAVSMLPTAIAPGRAASWLPSWPMMMIRTCGEASAAGSITPTWRPGNRLPSWSAGVRASTAPRAREA